MLLMCVVAALAQAPAPPAGPVVNSLEDIVRLLPPPGATLWDPMPVVAAINASTFAFTPRHYYDLLDRGSVRPDIVKAVAAKAAVFHDANAKPLPEVAAQLRRGAQQTTVSVGQNNFVVLFEFFNDVKNDMDGARARVGVLAPQASGESQNLFERRERVHREATTRAIAPLEGRIEATTFQVDLPATVSESDGCRRSVASVALADLEIELFRLAMGTVATTAPIDVRASGGSMETARFTIENPKRVEFIGRCGTTGTKLKMTLSRTHDGKWSGQGGF